MDYKLTDPQSIEEYGKRLIGANLATVKGVFEIPQQEASLPISGKTRGSLGHIIEKYYYGIQPKNDGTPDFKEAGVELKTTPIKKSRNGSFAAKERLVLGMIDYLAEAKKDFVTSSYYTKNEKLMLLSYLNDSNKTISEVHFLLAKLYEFNKLPKEDQKIIREDWEKINAKIKAGCAHQISEGDTMYLGACTKAATNKNLKRQVGDIPAKPRAFSYKSSYMTRLIERELGTIEDAERLITDADLSQNKTFEQQVLDYFAPFIGKNASLIAEETGADLNQNQKDKYAALARAMMGIKTSKIEEFEAAGIKMKTIRLKANGVPKEAMSFPTFKYKEIINEEWDGDEEDGHIRAEFQKQLESRFLFVIYRCLDEHSKREPILEKVFFWTMPQDDLAEAQKVWEETVRRINEGQPESLPTAAESSIAHVRPHASNANDTFETAQGTRLTKKCFWLNTGYLKKVVEGA